MKRELLHLNIAPSWDSICMLLKLDLCVVLQFSNLYEGAIDGSEKSAVPAKRIASIIDYLTYQIYTYIQRGLFERHKFIFALMLATRILSAMGKVSSSFRPDNCTGLSPNCFLADKTLRCYTCQLDLQVKPAEVDIFLKGGGALDINSVRKKPKVNGCYNHNAMTCNFYERNFKVQASILTSSKLTYSFAQ